MNAALVALLLAAPWPGETAAQAVDLTPLVPGTAAGFGQQVSDLFWNPQTRTLWVARAPGGVWALVETGDGGFRVGAAYPAINADSEGITQAGLGDGFVFVLDETGGFVRKYAVDGVGGATLVRAWNLSGVVAAQVGNAGPEGLAFVPDESLRDAGLAGSAFDAGGIFLVAHQSGGFVYAVDLDPASDTGRTAVGRLTTSRAESSALAFDRTNGRLFISHNTGTNFLETGVLTRLPDAGLGFQQIAEFDAPNTSNLEGFAVAPQDGWCFWADDDGNSVGRPGLMWFRQLPAALSIAAGDGQTAGAGLAVPVAPQVVVRDAFGNPLVGQTVSFTAGTGSVTGATPVTGPFGLAAVGAWTLGAPGPQQLTASALRRSVMFSATATADFVDAGTGDAGTGDAGTTDAGTTAPTDAGAGPPDAGTTSEVPRGCGCSSASSAWALLVLLGAARRRGQAEKAACRLFTPRGRRRR